MIALAADRLSATGARAGRQVASADVGAFVLPVSGDVTPHTPPITLALDPFDDRRGAGRAPGVASGSARPTVPGATARGRSLTAILVADERRVAVIDDETVTVGATLPDGARVAAILPDRVWVVEKNGRRHMLTLTRGQ